MNFHRCRFHIVGAEPSFQTVVTVELEMMGREVQTLRYGAWSACHPSEVALHDVVIGHVADDNAIELFRQFAAGFRSESRPLPRTIVVADQLSMDQEIELLKLGVADCLLRPLNLRRFSSLLTSVAIKSQVLGTADSATGSSAKELASRIAKLATVSASVLITGETGVGKSHYARQVHLSSSRAAQPFVIVNCSAIPESLFESELFGHERGAFTGADRKRVGKLEFAGGGTVFLDDVDAIPLTVQSKLLHAVENREFYPLGSNQAVKCNARFLSATNRNLEVMAGRGEFRLDLMYRLNAYELPISPLRERTDEIGGFITLFLDEFAAENQRPPLNIEPEAWSALRDYSWPGNIRELRNAIYSSGIDSDDNLIRVKNLPAKIREEIGRPRSKNPERNVTPAELGVSVPYMDEARRLLAALARHDFNRTEAAAELGYSRTTLYHKLEKLHLS
jgi:two-component system NtrC family response regulator